jgi:cold shock CspA family protein
MQEVLQHKSPVNRECERCGIRPPKAGDKLKFEIERGRKGLRAIAVSYV